MRALPSLGLLLIAGALLYLTIGVVLALLTLHIAQRDLSIPANRKATGEEAIAILFLTIGWPVALYWAMTHVYRGVRDRLEAQRKAESERLARARVELEDVRGVLADAEPQYPGGAQPARLGGDAHGGLS